MSWWRVVVPLNESILKELANMPKEQREEILRLMNDEKYRQERILEMLAQSTLDDVIEDVMMKKMPK
jgi:hypothetical protein